MIFCKINDKLISIIKKYAHGRIIIDCGCGDGLLGSMMQGVVSIDLLLHPDSLIKNTLIMDIMNFPFDDNMFPFFIRPCHGHFVQQFLNKNKDIVRNCFYISNPKNLEYDINTEEYEAEQVEDWIGEDGERIYLIHLNEGDDDLEDLRTFVRVAYGTCPENTHDCTWWEKTGDKLINSVGGYHYYNQSLDNILETVEAEDFEDLDWSKTYLNDSTKVAGWLEPDGTFHGCGYEGHDSCAYYLLKKSVDALESSGVIRIYSKSEWFCKNELTEAQARFLIDKGYLDNSFGELDKASERLSIGKEWAAAKRFIPKDGD
jgi:hypothetical protein